MSTSSPSQVSQFVFALQKDKGQTAWKLFLASFIALYCELIIIRYLSTEVRAFAYIKNLPLIASFFGIGLGMIMGPPRKALRSAFPAVAFALFAVTAFASALHITHISLPGTDYYVWGLAGISVGLKWLRFIAIVVVVLALIVAFFVTVGGIVGEYIALFPPLRGYGINLGGSLAGVVVFTLFSFLSLPPICWTFVAFLCLAPFFLRWNALVFFLLATAITFNLRADTFWSPYYRIDLRPYPVPQGWSQPAGYYLNVNHDFHLNMLDLSDNFLSHYPNLEPNSWAVLNYDLPYKVIPHPGRVLVVGAGSGNDVAAALRHSAGHVDAVEIDPTIIKLGRRFHPEHPYDSQNVTIFNDDARAYFKKTNEKYDLIVFGFLDSQTLLSSFSSVRLDNFVYTRESFREASQLLNPEGAIVVAFASGRSFVNERMYATLTSAVGSPPSVYENPKNPDISFIVKRGRPAPDLAGDLNDVSAVFHRKADSAMPATDHWPFLYLAKRTIPDSILFPVLIFLAGCVWLSKYTQTLPSFLSGESMHLFFLGAGFLLLETKGITELSLLFGSTWIVNAVVITAFLCMALLANILAMLRHLSSAVAYGILFVLLGLGVFLPYSIFVGLSGPTKVTFAATIAALPVFFSGLIFSCSLRNVTSPAQALGINLLGAVVGGSLENIVMIGGTVSLGVLAIVLYGVSLLASLGVAKKIKIAPQLLP